VDGEAGHFLFDDDPYADDAFDRLASAVGRMDELQGQLGQVAASIRSLACQRRAVVPPHETGPVIFYPGHDQHGLLTAGGRQAACRACST
jgi:hypothetical protein